MRQIAAWMLTAGLSTLALAAIEPGISPSLSAARIVEKNVAARGGLDAWRKIQTMVWVGRVESGNGAAMTTPFLLELKRPNKTRFELKVSGARSVRSFDGNRGWKAHSGRNGQPEVQPYSDEESKFARDSGGLDGPLIDYQAKGIAVTLDGIDEVAGRKAYRLNVLLPSGTTHHIWIDAATFLDIKSDRKATNVFGPSGTVSVFYRDYRMIDGVQIPMTIETAGGMGSTSDRMSIDRVAVNPELNDREFARPVSGQSRTVSIDSAEPHSSRPASRALPSAAPGLSGAVPGANGAGNNP